ncbi:Deoxyribose-phosphate aldolase [Caldithrix abyssi DSM 13497]|uniref:Deoxyribose-phosphate aldolase n=1 Tax=Caldithrix abyssi DSM 13497 TaxID=880073 RepID=H1XQG3_CALAY|nr:deoxyribose-phosphate aldolase [Caldithrix abyssi]APF19961.1 deoC deoxyribose-phosphate aldolase [Caldithrix abyssi DSM 13497]EHO40050.1 Deoxyribose-phosphate aldolase [Caldithrix abyssi DSM 13497]
MSSITPEVIERIISQVIAESNLSGVGAIRPFSYDAADELISFGANRIGAVGPTCPPKRELARWIDHTILKPDATRQEIEKICDEAIEFGFASVCVNPTWVPLVYKKLRGHSPKVCTVVGFPLGATFPEVKARETELAVQQGADEIDMVINIGALKSGDYELVEHDIRSVVRAAGRRIVKVIIESCLLTDEEKVKACTLAKIAGANYVKTSTGFSKGGATVKDVALMRKVVGSQMGVKASGGVRSYEEACQMVEAGATRIGASASVAIVANGSGEKSEY